MEYLSKGTLQLLDYRNEGQMASLNFRGVVHVETEICWARCKGRICGVRYCRGRMCGSPVHSESGKIRYKNVAIKIFYMQGKT